MECKLRVPIGERGEICTRGYSVMRGYWNDEERTRETIDPAGWLQSGDLGIMDDEGYVQVVGRIKDMVIRGGENIYPREVEEFLYTHPAIAEVQVFGVPDEKMGEEVCAWVQLHPGHSLTEVELKDFCKGGSVLGLKSETKSEGLLLELSGATIKLLLRKPLLRLA